MRRPQCTVAADDRFRQRTRSEPPCRKWLRRPPSLGTTQPRPSILITGTRPPAFTETPVPKNTERPRRGGEVPTNALLTGNLKDENAWLRWTSAHFRLGGNPRRPPARRLPTERETAFPRRPSGRASGRVTPASHRPAVVESGCLQLRLHDPAERVAHQRLVVDGLVHALQFAQREARPRETCGIGVIQVARP